MEFPQEEEKGRSNVVQLLILSPKKKRFPLTLDLKPFRSCFNEELDPVQPFKITMYQSNTCTKDLHWLMAYKIHWLHFDDEPRVQDRQQMKKQQSYISVSIVSLKYLSSSCAHQPRKDNSIPGNIKWQIL